MAGSILAVRTCRSRARRDEDEDGRETDESAHVTRCIHVLAPFLRWRAAWRHVVARRPHTGRTARGTVSAVLVRILGPSRSDLHAEDGVCLRTMVAALAIRRPAS